LLAPSSNVLYLCPHSVSLLQLRFLSVLPIGSTMAEQVTRGSLTYTSIHVTILRDASNSGIAECKFEQVAAFLIQILRRVPSK
ncbi:hypothetical protein BHM03_00052621, partial [Ensete ventricosum]